MSVGVNDVVTTLNAGRINDCDRDDLPLPLPLPLLLPLPIICKFAPKLGFILQFKLMLLLLLLPYAFVLPKSLFEPLPTPPFNEIFGGKWIFDSSRLIVFNGEVDTDLDRTDNKDADDTTNLPLLSLLFALL